MNREDEGLRISTGVSGNVRNVFINDARRRLASLSEALEENHFEKNKGEVRLIAHNFKGNAGFLGLSPLEKVSRKLDRAFKRNAPNDKLKLLTRDLMNVLTRIIRSNTKETI